MEICFGTIDGKELGKLGEVSELDLTCEDSEPFNFDSKPIEIPVKFDNDPYRAFLPQGMYNAYVLKRDGYLSPKNGWFGG